MWKGCNDRIGEKMEIVYVNIGQIIPYENNPRKNEKAVDMVADSIKRYGFKVPVVLDRENVIVAGHTRVLAAEQLGFKKVPVIYADDLTDEQIKAFRLADNKTAEQSLWDLEKLDEELSRIAGIDMTQFELYAENAFNHEEFFTQDPITETENEKTPKRYQCPHCGEWVEE